MRKICRIVPICGCPRDMSGNVSMIVMIRMPREQGRRLLDSKQEEKGNLSILSEQFPEPENEHVA